MLHYATISFSQLDWPSSNINNIQFVAPDKWRTWGPHSGTRGCLELHQRGGERINIWNSLSELKYKTNINRYILFYHPFLQSPVNNHSETGFIQFSSSTALASEYSCSSCGSFRCFCEQWRQSRAFLKNYHKLLTTRHVLQYWNRKSYKRFSPKKIVGIMKYIPSLTDKQ